MANSAKGAGNFLVPLVVVAILVIGVLAITFSMSGEEPPDEATIIPEENEVDREAGSGTLPEGAADENMEGVTDQLGEVDPAAPGENSVPPADLATGGPDDQTEGETAADEEVEGGASEPVVKGVTETGEGPAPAADEGTAEGGAEGNAGAEAADDEAAARLVPESGEAAGQSEEIDGAAGEYLLEDDSAAGEPVDTTEPSGEEGRPPGRDAETNLTPEPGQDVVEDTDEGGAPFVPTPSGPEGRDANP